jgi:NAD(P)-dependent dehydrogenase (short-subunit alcohol dehydrogenase family)
MAYQPFDLSGKVALVTGGNGGIGLGMAEALAQAGADVIIWGTNEGKNAAALERLKAHGTRVDARRVDVSDEQQVVEETERAVAQFGRLDSVIANAGIGGGARSFSEFDTAQYRRVLAVNLDGAFWTLREAAKHMVARAGAGDKGGSLIGVASTAAIEGAARNQAYAASKGGLVSMLKAIAVEHARYGVTANGILPGWIATEMTQGAQDNPTFAEKVLPRVPVRRWGEPSDFGGIAVYLASSAAVYHTGQMFVIDGGYTIF